MTSETTSLVDVRQAYSAYEAAAGVAWKAGVDYERLLNSTAAAVARTYEENSPQYKSFYGDLKASALNYASISNQELVCNEYGYEGEDAFEFWINSAC